MRLYKKYVGLLKIKFNQKITNMKRAVFTFFAILMFCGAIRAQITIDSTDMPVPGDIIRTSIFSGLDSLYGASYTATGASHTWNFNNLGWFKQKVDTFVNVDETRFASYYAGISNVAYNITISDLPIPPGLPNIIKLKAGFAYLNTSSTKYTQVGLGGDINVSIVGSTYYPTHSVYDTVDVIYKFPLTFNNRDSSTSFFVFSLNMGLYSGQIFEHKKRVNFVDGWGSITTPLGTFNCMRLKSFCTIHDSLSVSGIIDSAINRTTTEYIWLTKQHHEPILKVMESEANGSMTYQVQYIDPIDRFLGINEPDLVSGLNIYPNPAQDLVNLNIPVTSQGNINIELFNVIGSKVAVIYNGNLSSGVHQIRYNTGGLDKGIYFIKLSSQNNKPVTRRLMIN